MKEYIILFNPSSGNGRSLKKKKKVLALLDNNSIEYDLFMTESEGHLRSLTKSAVNNYKTIIGVGGDTTFNIIAGELLNIDEKINVIPSIAMIGTGSANDIMKSIGMYPLKEAVSAIKNNKIDYLDIGKIQKNSEEKEHFFLGSMSVGLGTTVNRYVEELKNKNRIVSKMGDAGQFIAGVLGVKSSFKNSDIPISLTIEYDGKKIEKNVSLLVVLNTPIYGSGIKFIDNCSPFDGKLNCVLINTKSFFETLSFYIQLERKRKDIKNFKSEKIDICFNKCVDIQLDGEILENIKELKISIVPNKLKIIVP